MPPPPSSRPSLLAIGFSDMISSSCTSPQQLAISFFAPIQYDAWHDTAIPANKVQRDAHYHSKGLQESLEGPQTTQLQLQVINQQEVCKRGLPLAC